MDPRKPPFVRPWLRLLACLSFVLAIAACDRGASERLPSRARAQAALASAPTHSAAVDQPSRRDRSAPRAATGKPAKRGRSVPPAAALEGGRRLTGPYVHENLAVYLVHATERDDREFITLDEGLKRGVVEVSEKEHAEVGRLLLENKADKPLFLQEGDRLQGGKQDRMVHSSLVVAPDAGAREVPSFCIEQSRWSAGLRGKSFSGSSTQALSPKSVRMAGKVSRSQSGVWDNVARTKSGYARSLGSGNTNSSLNEALDGEAVRKAAGAYEKALRDLPNAHADAIGAVFVVEDRIEEVDMYPGHPLFARVYPRLLQSFAGDAAHRARMPNRTAKTEPPTLADVRAFLRGRGKPMRNEALDPHNTLDVFDLGSRYHLRTTYRDLVVHEQIMAKDDQG